MRKDIMVLIVIFIFGLILVLLHNLEAQLPVLFGMFGKAILLKLVNAFPVWLSWLIMTVGYLMIGYSLLEEACYGASGTRKLVVNPDGRFADSIIWILFWPAALIIIVAWRRL